MPIDGETRACIHPGCDGTQTFYPHANLPDPLDGREDPEVPNRDKVMRAAWVCDVNQEHCEMVWQARHHHAMR